MTGKGAFEDEEVTAQREHAEFMAGTPMRQIPPTPTDEQSLGVAIRYADTHPFARPFAIKGAARLGRIDALPDWPEVTEVVVDLNRVSARITASGALVAAATGRPLVPPTAPPSRSIKDRADLLAAIQRNPADPLTRRALVDLAQAWDRLRWIPKGWPVPAAPLAPGAEDVMFPLTHHGHTREEERQVQRERVHGRSTRRTDRKARHLYPVDPPVPVRQR